MAASITKSGPLFDEHGQFVLITQGLSGYTLVAGKKILFRLYLDLSAAVCPTVVATITYKYFGFQPKKTVVIPASSLIIETESPNGPSVGVLFSGDVFPRGSLGYDVDFYVQGDPTPEAHFRMTNLVFQTPGRLRLLIHNLVGRAPWGTEIRSDFGWLAEMYQSLERLSAMMPIRDGIKFGLQHTDVGLCFIYGDEIDTWPEVCPSGNGPPCTPDEMIALLLAEAQRINGLGTSERVDATVSWRPRDYSKPPPPEGAAGQGTYDAPTGSGLAIVVGGKWVGKEMTGAILAQELGHVFGCEPPDSPHYEDPRDGKHSKTPGHNDPFAFDMWLLKPYALPAWGFLGDVMNNFGGGVSQGRDMVLFNAFDWEHLRKRLTKLPGASREPYLAARPTQKRREQLAAELEESFADEPSIDVADPSRGLPARRGYAWHWTSRGFQPGERSAARTKSRSALGPSVEGIRAWLEELGIDKAYVPIADRPVRRVIDPQAPMTLHRSEFLEDSFGWVNESGRRSRPSHRP